MLPAASTTEDRYPQKYQPLSIWALKCRCRRIRCYLCQKRHHQTQNPQQIHSGIFRRPTSSTSQWPMFSTIRIPETPLPKQYPHQTKQQPPRYRLNSFTSIVPLVVGLVTRRIVNRAMTAIKATVSSPAKNKTLYFW